MSRDGLLPKLFSAVHPKYKTPYWSTWIACFAVGIPAGLVDIGDAADLANIGTLFAFVLVSLGVILLRRNQPDRKRAFRVPFVPWFPLISVVLCGGLMFGLTLITWLRFVIWLALGLVIYIFYSRHHSEFCKKRSGDRVIGPSGHRISDFELRSPDDPIIPIDPIALESLHAFGALQLHPLAPEGRTPSASRRLDRAVHAARTAPASRDGRRLARRSRATLQLQRLHGLPRGLQGCDRTPAHSGRLRVDHLPADGAAESAERSCMRR